MTLKQTARLGSIGLVFGLLFAALYVAFSTMTGLSADSSAVAGGIGAACGVIAVMWQRGRES